MYVRLVLLARQIARLFHDWAYDLNYQHSRTSSTKNVGWLDTWGVLGKRSLAPRHCFELDFPWSVLKRLILLSVAAPIDLDVEWEEALEQGFWIYDG